MATCGTGIFSGYDFSDDDLGWSRTRNVEARVRIGQDRASIGRNKRKG
jgi:hypothetical protein